MTKKAADFPIVLISFFGLDLGVRQISSFLKSKGYPVYIVRFQEMRLPYAIIDNDYFINPALKHSICPPKDLELLIKLIKDIKPELIGLSLSSSMMRTAQKITEELRRHTQAFIAWGGVHATISPEECTAYADAVCIGEGECPMWELAEKMRNGARPANIPNLWIRSGQNIETNDTRQLIEDLDDLPFPDIVEDGNKFLIDAGQVFRDPPISSVSLSGVYPISTSRGCAYDCTFCCNHLIRERTKGKGRYLRRRSADNVIKELRFAIEHKPIAAVRFWDDIFTDDREWLDNFVQQYMKYIGKPFICYGHPFRVDPGILRILAETGLFEVWTGIQSASERVRSGFLGRMKSNVDIFEYTGLLHKFYIMPRYEIIADNPFETEEDNRSAIEFLSRLKHPYNMHFYSLCYFAKTGLTQQALERGIIKSHELEQFTSKSINSFFMFLVKSKNKDDLYWNCLKAIAVNPYISKRYLKYCLNNIFFRIYPSCLLFLTRLYMRAVRFARSVILKKRRVIPFVIAGLQPEHVKLSNYIYFAGQKSLKFEKRADFMLFPEPIEAEGHGFCFKVENHLARSLSLQFFFEVHPFHVKEVGEKATWRWCVSVEALEKKILSLRFSYPHCLITHGQKSFEGKIIEKCLDTIDDDRTYILKIKYKVRFQQNPLEVARVLFSGKGNIPSFLKGPEE